MSVTIAKLGQFVSSRFGIDEGIGMDVPLLSSTLIDSFGLVELLAFIEKEEGFRVRPMEVTMENFDTIGRIMAFVSSRARTKETGGS